MVMIVSLNSALEGSRYRGNKVYYERQLYRYISLSFQCPDIEAIKIFEGI